MSLARLTMNKKDAWFSVSLFLCMIVVLFLQFPGVVIVLRLVGRWISVKNDCLNFLSYWFQTLVH